jgi:hypothetical protein
MVETLRPTPRSSFQETVEYLLQKAGKPLTTAQIREALISLGVSVGRWLSDRLAGLANNPSPSIIRLGQQSTRILWTLPSDSSISPTASSPYRRPYRPPKKPRSKQDQSIRRIYFTAQEVPRGWWIWRCTYCVPTRGPYPTAFCTPTLPAPPCPDCGKRTARTSSHTWTGRVEEVKGRGW